MQIPNVLSGYSGLQLAGPPVKQGRVEAATEAADRAGGAAAVSPSWHDVLSRYDVHRISPREFSALVEELHAAGGLSEADVRELSQVRLQLENAGQESDEPLDLVEFLTRAVADQRRELERLQAKHPGQPIDFEAALAPLKRELAWIEKFAAVDAGKTEGVDVVA